MKLSYVCLGLATLLTGCAVVPYDDAYGPYSYGAYPYGGYPYSYAYPAYPAYVGPPVNFSLGIGVYSGGHGGWHHGGGGWHHGGGGWHGGGGHHH